MAPGRRAMLVRLDHLKETKRKKAIGSAPASPASTVLFLNGTIKRFLKSLDHQKQTHESTNRHLRGKNSGWTILYGLTEKTPEIAKAQRLPYSYFLRVLVKYNACI